MTEPFIDLQAIYDFLMLLVCLDNGPSISCIPNIRPVDITSIPRKLNCDNCWIPQIINDSIIWTPHKLNCDLYLANINAHCAHPCGALKEYCEALCLPTDYIKPVEYYSKPSQISYRDIEYILETHKFSPWAQEIVDSLLRALKEKKI